MFRQQINQNRTFHQRLSDFGPELSSFLEQVWNARRTIDVQNYKMGSDQIYSMYSGKAPDSSYDLARLMMFVAQLRKLAQPYSIKCQEYGKFLGGMPDCEISLAGRELWIDFFHVASLAKWRPERFRLYVHAANWAAGLEIMKIIVGQFRSPQGQGLTLAKICGPGARRLDTVVAYSTDEASRIALIEALLKSAVVHPGWFIDSLPPLTKRVATGIGTTDEPPSGIEIIKDHPRLSYGSLYSGLIWVALKETPNVTTDQADGRHLLDNVLYTLRLLRIDPLDPTRFPEADMLEQWYQAKNLP
jgi:HopA1 effector protein family